MFETYVKDELLRPVNDKLPLHTSDDYRVTLSCVEVVILVRLVDWQLQESKSLNIEHYVVAEL